MLRLIILVRITNSKAENLFVMFIDAENVELTIGEYLCFQTKIELEIGKD